MNILNKWKLGVFFCILFIISGSYLIIFDYKMEYLREFSKIVGIVGIVFGSINWGILMNYNIKTKGEKR